MGYEPRPYSNESIRDMLIYLDGYYEEFLNTTVVIQEGSEKRGTDRVEMTVKRFVDGPQPPIDMKKFFEEERRKNPSKYDKFFQ